jgi:hypothetical protein
VYSPAGLVQPVPHVTSCTSNKSHLYFDSFFETVMSKTILQGFLIFHLPNLMWIFRRLCHLCEKKIFPDPRPFVTSRNMYVVLLLSATDYSTHSQPSIAGDRLHPQPEDGQCHGDNDRSNMVYDIEGF